MLTLCLICCVDNAASICITMTSKYTKLHITTLLELLSLILLVLGILQER